MANQVTGLQNVARVLLNTLRKELGSTFKTYWDGDPIAIGQSQLPALIVDWERADSIVAPTRHDRWRHSIVIKVLVNKMEDVSTLDTQGTGILIEVPTKKRLEGYIFARDKTTGEYKADTVLGVLRRKYTLEGRQGNQIANVVFGITERPGEGGALHIAAEGHIELTVDEKSIAVSNRT